MRLPNNSLPDALRAGSSEEGVSPAAGAIAAAFTLAAAILFLTPHLRGQQYAHIGGLIVDPSGASLPGARVTVVSLETGFRRVAESQPSGWYWVASLQPGTYKVMIRKEGFRTLVRHGVKLDVARPIRLDFVLPLGSVRDEITVSGSPPLLNTEDASVGTTIGRDQIERLPLNGRGMLSLLDLAPGTVVTPATRGEAGQFSTSGQRPNANYFLVDGVSANTGVSSGAGPSQAIGGTLPGLSAIGSLHAVVSLESVLEFRVQTSTATADFGRLPGAQVLVSSRSGSNDFHGSLSYYGRSGGIDANNWFANRLGRGNNSLALHGFGAALGGPVHRNRSFFFASYEGLRLREPFAWRSASPAPQSRAAAPVWAQAVLGPLPFPNGRPINSQLGEWNGLYRRRARADVASLRLDQAISSRWSMFARHQFAPSANEFSTTQINDLTLRSSSLTLGTSFVLGPSLVLEFKANRSDSRSRAGWRPLVGDDPCRMAPVGQRFLRPAAECGFLLRSAIAGVGQVAFGPEADQWQNQWHAVPSAAIAIGAHRLRLGLDYRRLVPRRNDRAQTISLIFESLDDLLEGRNLWVATSPPVAARALLSEYAAWANDTWSLHPQIALSLGVRWEYASAPKMEAAEVVVAPNSAYRFPGQTEIWRQSYGALAPRLGLAYRPRKNSSLVLRAGWGVFFDSSLSIATDLVNSGPFAIDQFLNGRNAPFSTLLSYAFAPGLRFPSVHQWNSAVERDLGGRGVLTAAYVGSSGRRLLRREFGGYGDSQTLWLAVATNHGESAYHGLQLQYRKPMARGFQALASYSWSHSIDNSSSDSLLHWVASDFDAGGDRGASDFDVRHSLTAAMTFETPVRPSGSIVRRLFAGWTADAIARVRSGFPVNVLNSEYSTVLSFSNAFRPDAVPGQPQWLSDPSAPGGRRLNPGGFASRAGLSQGNLGRNALRGFGMHQVDVSLRREFPAGEGRSLALRIELFNALNHPNFADPAPFLSSPLFGESPSMLNSMLGTGSPGSGLTPALQTGGARSLQLMLRYRF